MPILFPLIYPQNYDFLSTIIHSTYKELQFPVISCCSRYLSGCNSW